jgi:hypothetical protein
VDENGMVLQEQSPEKLPPRSASLTTIRTACTRLAKNKLIPDKF